MHKKQQSAPQLQQFSNPGSSVHQLNQTASSHQTMAHVEIMSNFEDKLNDLIRQIDSYLDV